MARKTIKRSASAARHSQFQPQDLLLAGIGAVSLGRKQVIEAYANGFEGVAELRNQAEHAVQSAAKVLQWQGSPAAQAGRGHGRPAGEESHQARRRSQGPGENPPCARVGQAGREEGPGEACRKQEARSCQEAPGRQEEACRAFPQSRLIFLRRQIQRLDR